MRGMLKPIIKIAIVEDDTDLRHLLHSILEEKEGINVVRSFSNGENFLRDFLSIDVDVVIMDINMPGKNGIECVAEAKPLKPKVQFLMSSVFENPTYIFNALCSGATGYILKNSSSDELLNAVRQIFEGGSPMSAQIARMVVSSFQAKTVEKIEAGSLSNREREILDLLAQGLMYKSIGSKLNISTETVRTHVRNIYEKLQVSSRMEAIRKVFPSSGMTE
jgi:DNA-binding NarL/FixJ family response regulator